MCCDRLWPIYHLMRAGVSILCSLLLQYLITPVQTEPNTWKDPVLPYRVWSMRCCKCFDHVTKLWRRHIGHTENIAPCFGGIFPSLFECFQSIAMGLDVFCTAVGKTWRTMWKYGWDFRKTWQHKPEKRFVRLKWTDFTVKEVFRLYDRKISTQTNHRRKIQENKQSDLNFNIFEMM